MARSGTGEKLRSGGRTGRNLPAAIASGLVLAALVIASLLIGPIGWYLLVAAAVVIGTAEVARRMAEAGRGVPLILLLVLGQATIWASWFFGPEGLAALGALSGLAIFLFSLFRAEGDFLAHASNALFVYFWIPVLASLSAMVATLGYEGLNGSLIVVAFLLCVIASDVGGFAAGVAFGRHPMVPAISPKKSWEGFAGSLVASAVVGALAMALLVDSHWGFGLVFGPVLAVCATLGDLVESQFKRTLGIKDMSRLIPGHGGIMDRVDGILPAGAATWMFLWALPVIA